MTSLLDLAEPPRLAGHPPSAPAAVPVRGTALRPPSRRTVLRLLAVAAATPVATVATVRFAGPDDGPDAPLPAVDPAAALTVTAGTVVLAPGAAAPHVGHAAPDSLGHRAWTTTVRADLVVANNARQPVAFSPGQVRLRLPDGTTVQPVAWQDSPGAVAAGTTTRLWVDYLTPDPAAAVGLDYTPAGRTEAVRLLDATVPAASPGAGR